ncbi:MAG: hypothetical protein QOK08_581 [Actinomycetota bacterium]|nr:hypothetical protein [Actinomycetota bacterium]
MSRRPIAAPTLLGVIAIVVVASLTGCTSHKTSSPTSGSTPATAPTTSAPTPTPTPTFVAKAYTCRSILPPATLAVFDSKASAGFTLQKDYVERVRNFSPDLSQFAEWGGILCQWAYPNTQQSVDYGFSAITAQQTTTEQASHANNGYAGTPKYNGTVFVNSDTADYPDTYLFINGYWFYASTDSLLGLIVDNVFATPDH